MNYLIQKNANKVNNQPNNRVTLLQTDEIMQEHEINIAIISFRQYN
jgi:hypothetical protein